MLFYKDLDQLIFDRHNRSLCDELVIVSGYIGPSPVKRLATEMSGLQSTIVYGMYGVEGIKKPLHETLSGISTDFSNLNIRYSTIPIHAKCYVWKLRGDIVYALAGSANFSTNGLTTPWKEILTEIACVDFSDLSSYINFITEKTISCVQAPAPSQQRPERVTGGVRDVVTDQNVCDMALYSPASGEVQDGNGLNWGFAIGAHVHPNDANIPIRTNYIRGYPYLFPPKTLFASTTRTNRGRPGQRHNDEIEIIWDDGTTMIGLLEGSQMRKGDIVFPKQISSFPEKQTLGIYLRSRIGVEIGKRVTRADLERYGRATISVSRLADGIYFFDFSVT